MKKNEAFGQINAMKGVVKLEEITNIIKSIDNFKIDTLDKLNPVEDYREGDSVININDIYIDLSYQRKLKIQELINRLIKYGCFDKAAAGNIDLAKRKDQRLFGWDGFHRAIMAAISGCTRIPAAIYIHDRGLSPQEEQAKEANLFEMRNCMSTKVSAGALFKSQVTGLRPEALKTLDVMKSCSLNIEGINPDTDAYDLGGFAFFLKHYRNYDVAALSDASAMIRNIWHNQKTMSVTLLIGLTHFLTANLKPDVRVLGYMEISNKLTEIVNAGKKMKNQQHFMQPMLKGKPAVSVCYNLCNAGISDLYNDNGKELKSFLDTIGLTEDEIEAMDRE